MNWRKWNKKLLVGMIGLVVIAAVFLGCAEQFDPAAYTQALLDVSYKNQTAQYEKIAEVTKEEAEKVYEENIDLTVETFSNLDLPEDLQKDYRELFQMLTGQVDYVVGEAAEAENKNYTVEVTTKPITLFDDTYQAFQEQAKAYAEKVSNDVMAGAEMPSDEEMRIEVYRLYYDILKGSLDQGAQYGEEQVITIHTNRNEEGEYEIPEEDMQQLGEALISTKKLQE